MTGLAGLPDRILYAVAFTAFLGTFGIAALALRASARKGGQRRPEDSQLPDPIQPPAATPQPGTR